jgi:alkyl hydroperoxide reductase subunit AhpF
MIFSGIETAVLTGGLSAIGAALYSIGVPKDSVLQYETAIKADGFLVIAHGNAEDVARAKGVLSTSNPASLDVHSATDADQLVAANG